MDTAGQAEYKKLRSLSYAETDVILLCFAVDCRQSLINVKKKWIHEIRGFLPGVPVVLVGMISLFNCKQLINLV